MNARQVIDEAVDPKRMLRQVASQRKQLEINPELLSLLQRPFPDYRELWRIHMDVHFRRRSPKLAAWFFPNRPKRYVDTMSTLSGVMGNWATALRQLEDNPNYQGHDTPAFYMKTAASCYSRLPDYAKWMGPEFTASLPGGRDWH